MQRSSWWAAAALTTFAAPALADGTEALGPMQGVELAQGNGLVLAGIGLLESQPNTLEVIVPEGAQVLQVLAWWDGFHGSGAVPGTTDTIRIGGQDVEGTVIGGPTNFFATYQSAAYRADITALGLVGPGVSVIEVEGLDFDYANNGLSLGVVIDDGEGPRQLAVLDGSDYAYGGFYGTFDSVAPVTFDLEAVDEPRSATLGLVVGGVGTGRTSVLRVHVDDVLVVEQADPLTHNAGPEWDVLEVVLDLPAGAASVTAQLFSEDLGTGPLAGGQVSSFTWIAATLEADLPQAEPDPHGCPPWAWACHWYLWDPWCTADNVTATVRLSDSFNGTFGVSGWQSGMSSCAALWHGLLGMGNFWCPPRRLLNREAAAALANADAGIGYPLDVQQVIDLYRDAVGADAGPETIGSALCTLYELNRLGCPW